MKMILSAVAATAVMFVGAPAFAASAYGSVGYSQMSVDLDELEDGASVDMGLVTARIGAKFTDNFGVEGEASLGTGGDSVDVMGVPVDVEVKSLLGVYAVGFVPLGDQFEIHGRAGVGTMKVEAEAGGFSDSGSDEGFLYGVGASFYPTQHHGVRADYTSDSDAHIFSIAYAFRF